MSVSGCNLERVGSEMSCPHCGPPHPETKPDRYDEVEFLVRATCDDADEADLDDGHGPRLSHWFCSSCERYFTMERLVGLATLQIMSA